MVDHITYDKAYAQERLLTLEKQISLKNLPDQPILFVTGTDGYLTELDTMLISQQRGWTTFNGYSGNFPPGYNGITMHCISLPERINAYMAFSEIESKSYYQDLMQRTVIINDTSCDPNWKTKNPAYSGVLPEEIFQNLRLEINSLTTSNGEIVAEVNILNNSSFNIPAISSTEQPFLLYTALIRTTDNEKAPYFNTQERLPSDVPADANLLVTVQIKPANYSIAPGCYLLEITAGQARTDHRTNGILPPFVRSTQKITIDQRKNALLGCE